MYDFKILYKLIKIVVLAQQINVIDMFRLQFVQRI